MYKLDKLELRWPQAAKVSTRHKLGRTHARTTLRKSAHAQRPSRPIYPHEIMTTHTLQGRGICIFFCGENKTLFRLSPRKENTAAPFSLCCSCPRSPARRSAAGPSSSARLLSRPPHKQKMRARSIRREPAHHVYRTCSKKRRLPAQENTRRHARLSRTCFGRNRRPASTTTLFPFSFSTKEKKKENRSKFSRFKYIARTHFVRPHDVRVGPPRLVR